MPTVISDPLSVSLLTLLAQVGLNWRDISRDELDASYETALDAIARAGFVDTKIEVVLSLEGRLGSIRALFHCYGACGELLNREAEKHASHNPDWLNGDGRLI